MWLAGRAGNSQSLAGYRVGAHICALKHANVTRAKLLMRISQKSRLVLRLSAAIIPIVVIAAADSPAPLAVPVAHVSATASAQPADIPAAAVVADEAVSAALRSLAPHVTRMSHPAALRTALEAYYSYRDANPDRVRKAYFYFVDLGLDNSTARGYVFDMGGLELVDGPFMVAHGRGSSASRNGVPTTFSNRAGSYASSLGLYLAQETYTFQGKSGGRSYSSVGLRMQGESGRFNSAARARGIVAHGAPYVSSRESGRSEGCPAMEQQRAARLLPLLADGGVVFIYSPRDTNWLREDPWIQAAQTP